MKNKTLQMQIASPCSQDWAGMKPQGAGRHCAQCDRVVMDFYDLTDSELLRLFQKHEGKLCGRFREDQLNREIPFLASPPQNSHKAMGALLSGLLLAGGITAQTKPDYYKTEIVRPFVSTPLFILEGMVTDHEGNPLEYASVLVQKTGGIGTVTALDGFFSIELPANFTSAEVTISYVGYEPQTIRFDLPADIVRAENIKVVLKPARHQLTEVVVKELRNRTLCQITGGATSVIREKSNIVIPKKKVESPIINVYPNPFVNHCQVDMVVSVTDAYLFCVYNAHEQLIYAESFQLATGRVNVGFSLPDGLPAASYWLRITRGSELLCTKQLMKQ